MRRWRRLVRDDERRCGVAEAVILVSMGRSCCAASATHDHSQTGSQTQTVESGARSQVAGYWLGNSGTLMRRCSLALPCSQGGWYVSDMPRCRVLVVEDEAMIAMLVEDMVTDFGSEVIGPAASIKAALDLAREEALDAAILDINVDGTDTYVVADVLRERGIPFIFASGYGASVLPSRFQGGRTLPKPFSYPVLAAALREALENQPCHSEAA